VFGIMLFYPFLSEYTFYSKSIVEDSETYRKFTHCDIKSLRVLFKRLWMEKWTKGVWDKHVKN